MVNLDLGILRETRDSQHNTLLSIEELSNVRSYRLAKPLIEIKTIQSNCIYRVPLRNTLVELNNISLRQRRVCSTPTTSITKLQGFILTRNSLLLTQRLTPVSSGEANSTNNFQSAILIYINYPTRRGTSLGSDGSPPRSIRRPTHRLQRRASRSLHPL